MIVHPEIPGVVHVTVSIPDSYLAAAIAASSSRPRNATADTDVDPNADKGAEAEAEHRELERLREIVGRALPSLDSPDRLRVLVTSYPAMSPDPAERRPEALDSRRPPIDRPTAADVTIQSEVAGPASHQALPDLPREAWLAATSVLVGILAGFLWWAGSRSGGQPEESFPSWKASDDDDHTGASEERRLAA